MALPRVNGPRKESGIQTPQIARLLPATGGRVGFDHRDPLRVFVVGGPVPACTEGPPRCRGPRSGGGAATGVGDADPGQDCGGSRKPHPAYMD